MGNLYADISGFLWSITAKGGQLAVKRNGAPMILFHNFRETVCTALFVATLPANMKHVRTLVAYGAC